MKKLILLALAPASVAAFALPAAASAIIPLHIEPAPSGTKTIHGVGGATLQAAFGNLKCTASSGTATFENGTTGTFQQTFTGCTDPFGGACTTEGQLSGTIKTLGLPFHLATVEHTPSTGAPGRGILITPVTLPTGKIVTFKCPFLGQKVLEGTGLIGTITKPECGKEETQATISFTAASQGVQTHKTLAGTATEYSLHEVALVFHDTITVSGRWNCT